MPMKQIQKIYILYRDGDICWLKLLHPLLGYKKISVNSIYLFSAALSLIALTALVNRIELSYLPNLTLSIVQISYLFPFLLTEMYGSLATLRVLHITLNLIPTTCTHTENYFNLHTQFKKFVKQHFRRFLHFPANKQNGSRQKVLLKTLSKTG